MSEAYSINREDMIGESNLSPLCCYMVFNTSHLHNGHNQLSIPKPLTLEQVKEFMKELESFFESSEVGGSYYPEARFLPDGSGSIYLVDYWPERERKDKIVLSWDGD